MPISDTVANVAGSIPVMNAVPPWTLASACRTSDTVETPGRAATSSAADMLKPVNEGEVR